MTIKVIAFGYKPRKAKRTVAFNGRVYRVRSDKIELPDLTAMSDFEALKWLCNHTYATGYSRPNSLAGMGGAISVGTR